MTTYYVGPGGNDANDGLSWANRKLTLNGAEDIPVAAGDTVYVGAGTYTETFTADVDGSDGNIITYIGDYTGANTDGMGGVVNIVGTITNVGRIYRTYRGFDVVTINSTNSNYAIIDGCATGQIILRGTSDYVTVKNCLVVTPTMSGIYSLDAQNDRTIFIENNIFLGESTYNGYGIYTKYGGVVVRNNLFYGCYNGIFTVLNAGQTISVYNNIFYGNHKALIATDNPEIVEDYNTFYNCTTERTNVDVGANSLVTDPNFDTRWFFEMVNGGTLLTPFDLASYSELIDVAGTSPTSTDMRGTSAIGGTREWGALEYDPDLKIEAGSGGGGVRNVPIPVFISRRR